MANITTYDLIECSRLYPTLTSQENAGLAAYVNLYVEFDSDPEQSYQVRKNDQSRFYHPQTPAVGETIYFSVTSLKFNGIETLNAPANVTFSDTDLIHIDFPNYAAAPNGYTAGVANAVDYSIVGASVGFVPLNFSQFLQGVFTAVNIDEVTVLPTHNQWWMGDGFPRLDNFAIEKYSSSDFDITIVETLLGVDRTLRYVSNGTTVEYYVDGVLHASPPEPDTEMPQYGDAYSFYQNTFTYTTVQEITSCPIVRPFYATLTTDGCTNLSVDCDCQTLTFSDNSVYDNGLVGHDPSYFDFRHIVIRKPNGETYTYTTDVTDTDADEYIQPHYNSNNVFNYAFQDDDTDGIYEIQVCTYPAWQSGIYYDALLFNRVERNGKFYKQVASSTSVDPELDTNNDYWIELTEDERGDVTTRYCAIGRIAVICIGILKCYRNLVKEAFCGLESNPCQPACENEDFQKAMKIRLTLDSLEFAICAGQWVHAERHVEILKSICCCGG